MANENRAEADTSPIVSTVDQHGDRLDSHEARLANLETDTRILQSNTNTQPSTNKVAVPTVREVNATAPTDSSSSSPASVSEPSAPVATVTAYREIVIDAGTSDCEYTYSDGTKHTFRWKTTNPQGSWVQDGGMGEGRWVATTQTNGYCDNRAIGKLKS